MSDFDFVKDVLKQKIEHDDIIIFKCDKPNLEHVHALRSGLDNEGYKNMMIVLTPDCEFDVMKIDDAKALLQDIINKQEHDKAKADMDKTIENLRVKNSN